MIADRAPPSTHRAASQLVGWEQKKASFGFSSVHQVILQILDWSHKDNVSQYLCFFISHPGWPSILQLPPHLPLVLFQYPESLNKEEILFEKIHCQLW